MLGIFLSSTFFFFIFLVRFFLHFFSSLVCFEGEIKLITCFVCFTICFSSILMHFFHLNLFLEKGSVAEALIKFLILVDSIALVSWLVFEHLIGFDARKEIDGEDFSDVD